MRDTEDKEMSGLTVFTLSIILNIAMALAVNFSLDLMGLIAFSWQASVGAFILIQVVRLLLYETKTVLEVTEEKKDGQD